MSRQAIADALIPGIEWKSFELGHCECPARHLHSHETSPRPCRITLDKAPTIFCFHSNCREVIDGLNKELRRECWKLEHGGEIQVEKRKLTKDEKLRMEQARRVARLKKIAQTQSASLPEKFPASTAEYFESSPRPLGEDDPEEAWRLMLFLFEPTDVLWIGRDTRDSANDGHNDEWIDFCRSRFRMAKEWQLEKECPGNFTCPSTFRPGSFSRSNGNVLVRRYLVVESDTLAKDAICSVFKFISQFCRLRAIVDTAGKSLHGWFDLPGGKIFNDLQVMLPELGCDRALFKPSQPCRLPGAWRGEKLQTLIYLDP